MAEGHELALVLSQPDRPAGRGLLPGQSPVKRFALAHGLELYQPGHLKDPADQARIAALGADALVVAAYGLILPKALLTATRLGAINIHASLLPRWRGAAPIQRALLAGDAETGISIMQMDEGLDTGPVLAQRALPIGAQDDAATLHDKLADLGAELVAGVLQDLIAGRARALPQPQAGVTYAAKIQKGEARLDWSRPAAALERAVRAYHPATTVLDREPMRVWRAAVAPATEAAEAAPGAATVAGSRLIVACGDGALEILELQRAGGKRLSAAEFLRGRTLPRGARFE